MQPFRESRGWLSSSLVPARVFHSTSTTRCEILPMERFGAKIHQARARKLKTVKNRSKLGAQLPALAGAAKDRLYLWRRRAATIAVGSLALVMAYGVVFGHNGLTAFAHKREEAKSLQQQMMQLQKENDRLHEHVDRLQNDPDVIEHEAREELHYTRAGEVIYTLPENGPDSTNPDSSATPVSKP